MTPARLDLAIIQGATLRTVLRIMQPRMVYRPITAIAPSAPVRLTVDHGLPGDWPVWVRGVRGLQALNAEPPTQRPHRAEVIDAQTLEINRISATGQAATGGELVYQPPVDLAGASARMQVRDAAGALLLDLSTANGGIAITGPGTLTLQRTAAETAALSSATGRYDLEVSYADGTVQRYLHGQVTVSSEVTYD